MLFADQLRAIEKCAALVNWPETVRLLRAMMFDRARAGYGSVLVVTYSNQVELLLMDWASSEGFEVTPRTDGVGLPAMWVAWGRKLLIGRDCDAEILADGSFRSTTWQERL